MAEAYMSFFIFILDGVHFLYYIIPVEEDDFE